MKMLVTLELDPGQARALADVLSRELWRQCNTAADQSALQQVADNLSAEMEG